jgi:amphi-Trp domain-containing protein
MKKSMGKETVLFKSEEKKSSSEIADALRQIAEKIDDGTMTLKKSSDEIQIEFPPNMVLELKIEEEYGRKHKKSLEIEIEWIIGEEQTDGAKIL